MAPFTADRHTGIDPIIAVDDPGAPDVRELIDTHLAFARQHTPPRDVHALDHGGLDDRAVTFYSARVDGRLVAIGALRQLDPLHAELKSMHTAETARRQGLGRAMVEHLVGTARSNGCTRVSLETASYEAFAPSRALYAAAGFEACEPFAEYEPSPDRVCMTMRLS